MSSDRRIRSSRANGALSRGPKTEAGKNRSRLNGVKHGIYAKSLVLGNESPHILAKLRDDYHQFLQPTNPVERDLIDEMIISKWLCRRAWTLETSSVNYKMEEQMDQVAARHVKLPEHFRTALAHRDLFDNSHALNHIQRAQARNSRMYHRALKQLIDLRGNPQIENEQPNPVPDPDASGPGMGPVVDGQQIGQGDPSVLLSGGETGVPQQFLDGPQIGPVGQQMSRIGVPETVRVNPGIAGQDRCTQLDNPPRPAHAQPLSLVVEQQSTPTRDSGPSDDNSAGAVRPGSSSEIRPCIPPGTYCTSSSVVFSAVIRVIRWCNGSRSILVPGAFQGASQKSVPRHKGVTECRYRQIQPAIRSTGHTENKRFAMVRNRPKQSITPSIPLALPAPSGGTAAWRQAESVPPRQSYSEPLS